MAQMMVGGVGMMLGLATGLAAGLLVQRTPPAAHAPASGWDVLGQGKADEALVMFNVLPAAQRAEADRGRLAAHALNGDVCHALEELGRVAQTAGAQGNARPGQMHAMLVKACAPVAASTPETDKPKPGAPQGGPVAAAPQQELEDDSPAPAAPNQTARKLLEEANKSILLAQFTNAVRYGKRALLMDPKMTDAHKAIGVAYARLGRYCDAKIHYAAYVEQNPDSITADRVRQILQGPELKDCP